MGRVAQKSDVKGSLKDIQRLINYHPTFINCLLKQKVSELKDCNIEWLSPIKEDDYSEYRDEDFIKILGVSLTKDLTDFWPKGGPQWDGLGKTDNGIKILLEAKANIPEIVSPGTKASPSSKNLILKSLSETKKYLNIVNSVDWSGKFYQYTNRLAHLYFLRQLNNIQAYLVNIYFINDKEVGGPSCKKEWLAALQVMKTYLGIGKHKLSKYMVDLYIDIEDL